MRELSKIQGFVWKREKKEGSVKQDCKPVAGTLFSAVGVAKCVHTYNALFSSPCFRKSPFAHIQKTRSWRNQKIKQSKNTQKRGGGVQHSKRWCLCKKLL